MTFDEAIATEKKIRLKTWPQGRSCQCFIGGQFYNHETKTIERKGPAEKVYAVKDGDVVLNMVKDVPQEWLDGGWELFKKPT